MIEIQKPRTRIHSLDALRAIMMLLGVVLHSTEIYLVQRNDPWPKDPNSTSLFLDYLEYFIHLFRMPIFFIMAGFFGALLFYERGSKKMLSNRISRILYPFVVFLLILFPIVYFLLIYVREIFSGNQNAFLETYNGFTAYLPEFTIHLWFLYYLLLITLFSFGIAILIKNSFKLKTWVHKIFNKLFQNDYLKVINLSVFIFIALVIIWELSPPTPLGWIPEIDSFLFYLVFYLFGWLIYTSKYNLKKFTKNAWLYCIVAVYLFCVQIILEENLSDIIKGIINAFTIALLIYGITGIFVNYFSDKSKSLKYISDGSYWVYLIHLPFTILIPGLLAGFHLSAIVKFIITLILTSLVCFSSYHFLVRKTFIGKFLNGKKY